MWFIGIIIIYVYIGTDLNFFKFIYFWKKKYYKEPHVKLQNSARIF